MDTLPTLPLRSEIPVEDTWNIHSVFPSDQAWEAACLELRDQLPGIAGFQGRLGEGPTILLQWFKTLQVAGSLLEKVSFYAYASHAVDTADQEANAKLGQARSLQAEFAAAVAFADPELMEVGFDKIRLWMDDEPRLGLYRHYFDKLENQKAHTRSAEVEEVLALAVDPFDTASATHGLLADADLRFAPARDAEGAEYEVGQGSINKLLSSPDRELRRTAWESYADGYLDFKNTMANCLGAAIKQNVFNMRVRKYPSALEASLAPNNIPTAVFHNLIEVYKQNLSTWHRYWRIRRQILGYDTLYPYDRAAPLTSKPIPVPFEQAMAWITAGMEPLGEKYVQVMRQGVMEMRWVDKYPNKGKTAGAFSYGVYGTHPFLLMSYSDRIFDMSTLAHELGHSMHSYFSWQTQPWIYSHYSIFIAEVASNFNQALVRAHLFESEPDPDFHIALIEETMSNFYRYFFIMPSLARFELETHERVERGEPLNAARMIELMADLLAEGFGEEVEIDRERVGITWAQFQHLYANFYVYQYATGISAANALAYDILTGKPNAVQNYLDFLKSGGSMYPLEALKLAGVDLSTPEPVEKAFETLSQIVDRLEKLALGG